MYPNPRRGRVLIEPTLQITTPARSCTYRANLTDHDTGAVVYLSSQPDRSRHRRRRVLIEPTHVLFEPTP